jgi:hypothetical protein
MKKPLTPCPPPRDVQRKPRCDSAIAWSAGAAAVCVPPIEATLLPSSTAMTPASMTMTSLVCFPEHAPARVGSMTSGERWMTWKGSTMWVVECLFSLYTVPHTLYLEQEVPLEQLSDIKAKSIVEWIANDRVRRSIVKHFRQFLMTYVDDHGASVYGQRIRSLGESLSFQHNLENLSSC